MVPCETLVKPYWRRGRGVKDLGIISSLSSWEGRAFPDILSDARWCDCCWEMHAGGVMVVICTTLIKRYRRMGGAEGWVVWLVMLGVPGCETGSL